MRRREKILCNMELELQKAKEAKMGRGNPKKQWLRTFQDC